MFRYLHFLCCSEGICDEKSLKRSDDGESYRKNSDKGPSIDPVMLKYMEMIKERRETENVVR